MGLANYYRQFVRGFSVLSKLLTLLTRYDQEWTWGSAQEKAF